MDNTTESSTFKTIYGRTADLLLELANKVWESEDTMQATWASTPLGQAVEFDRTQHATALVTLLFTQAWTQAFMEVQGITDPAQVPQATASDRSSVGACIPLLTGDYNLVTQIMPNLMPHSFILARHRCNTDLAALEAEFDKHQDLAHPTKTKKAKVEAGWPADIQAKFLKAQALAKTAKTFEKFVPPSWRVTPHGRTPALSDSGGVSNLPAAADGYVHIGLTRGHELKEAYVTWNNGAQSPTVMVNPAVPGEFWVQDMPENLDRFTSDSGGTMLGQVFLARGIAFDAWIAWALFAAHEEHMVPFYLVTKLNSIRLIGPEDLLTAIQGYLLEAHDAVPGFAWSWNTRAPLEEA